MSRLVVAAMEQEFHRFHTLAERALAQVPEAALFTAPAPGSNSLAIIVQHIGGNLTSRFTDFLTTDGEKPSRDREAEFAPTLNTRAALDTIAHSGWQTLFATLASLTDEDLPKTITIRQQPMTVAEALSRSLAHIANHVGQIIYLAHWLAGNNWQYLTIPPGGTQTYNQNPQYEKGLR